MHPPRRTSLLPTAAVADNRHNPKALTIATCGCRIFAGCGYICVPTTIYYPGNEGWSVSVAVVITT